ncbi:MAG: hypothetical protein ACREMR_00640 [Gemmatimonadales bacterium]
MIQHIDVHAMLQESVPGLYADLVTRPTGRAVRERITREIRAAGAAIALMDFSRVGCLDYSCADEIVAKLLREQITVLLLRGLHDGHREAIEPVLAGHGLAAVLERPDRTLAVLGPPESGEALLAVLIEQRVAERTAGGAIALVIA